MIHAYSLVHDDLPAMDDDDLRRGRPSCHVQFDEATAILAGDALLTAAFGLLASHLQPAAVAVRCIAELARAAGATGMVGGQSDDLEAVPTDSVEKLENIHRRKTAALIRVAVRMGGIVSSASEGDLNRLTNYGNNLGLAFQIVDDLLDEIGSESELGKRTGKDADAGKWTFPRLLGTEPSWERARKLVGDACQEVAGLGPQAEPLIELAHFVVSRRR
jgi:geranylgeranyl diphosphate synthase type II